MKSLAINIQQDRLEELCRRDRVRQLAVFGSVLRSDFGSGSDVDVRVTFEPDCMCDLFDISEMTRELEGLFGRHVDVIEKPALKNPFRKSISST